MAIEALADGKTIAEIAHKHDVHPHQVTLRNLAIERANQVWALDITYIPMARGWVHLVAVLDWASARPATPNYRPNVYRWRSGNLILNVGFGAMGRTLTAGIAMGVLETTRQIVRTGSAPQAALPVQQADRSRLRRGTEVRAKPPGCSTGHPGQAGDAISHRCT